MSTSYRTAKSRVEGLGSSHHGAGTWIKERVSALALTLLTGWAVWFVWQVAGTGYDGAIAALRRPVNAVLLALTLGVSIYHTQMGVRVIVEDYIHRPASKATLLVLNLFVCWALAAAGIFAVLRVALLPDLGA